HYDAWPTYRAAGCQDKCMDYSMMKYIYYDCVQHCYVENGFDSGISPTTTETLRLAFAMSMLADGAINDAEAAAEANRYHRVTAKDLRHSLDDDKNRYCEHYA
ncbi:unnamed protein product, partial [Prorocentrum cordatum]